MAPTEFQHEVPHERHAGCASRLGPQNLISHIMERDSCRLWSFGGLHLPSLQQAPEELHLSFFSLQLAACVEGLLENVCEGRVSNHHGVAHNCPHQAFVSGFTKVCIM